ncbi:MAG TPA: YdcF family protein [Verrucomicrobiae bacterium]|nr:YdcF family protein [Verrucomicrobiae bacterium]
MAGARRLVSRLLLFLAILLVALGASCRLWLPLIGRALVHDDGPDQAEIAVVLGGDYWGHRVETAAMLVRRGYVPRVLVSGPPGFYGANECDLAIPFAVRKGFPAAWFEAFPNNAMNTRDEARDILGELRRRGIKKALVVTSDYHSARARRIYRAMEKSMGGGPEIRVVAAPDQFFHADTWWRGRESEKVAFMEWCKTLANVVGL